MSNETHFPLQTRLLTLLPQARLLAQRYELDTQAFDMIEKQAQHFEVRTPLIGAFSSGKSSLINALLGESILSTDITPETAIPAEIRYADTPYYRGCLPDGQQFALAVEDMKENNLSHLQSKGWIEIGLPAPVLRSLPHIVLVDMPGWDSGIKSVNCCK